MIDGNWSYFLNDLWEFVIQYKWTILFWSLASIFWAANNRINFRFNESVFNRIENEKIRRWIKGDYEDDIKEIPILKWLSFTWDGFHITKGAIVGCYYLGLGFYNIWIAIFFGLIHLILFQTFYHVILKREKR